MEDKINKRIGNLEFCPSTYALPPDQYPKHPSWSIDLFFPNQYYGREDKYIKDNDIWYHIPNYPECKVHKSCFENLESCMTIATFDYNDGGYELHFVSSRPLKLTEEERETFWELVKYGYEQLNEE